MSNNEISLKNYCAHIYITSFFFPHITHTISTLRVHKRKMDRKEIRQLPFKQFQTVTKFKCEMKEATVICDYF